MAKQDYIVPEQEREFVTDSIHINLSNKTAILHVNTRLVGDDGKFDIQKKIINLTSLFQANLTNLEIIAFKKGIKLIIAEAWDKALNDIMGDVI